MISRLNSFNFSKLFSTSGRVLEREVNIIAKEGKDIKADEYIGGVPRTSSVSSFLDLFKSVFLNPNFREITRK